jgi:purine nucleoside permease
MKISKALVRVAALLLAVGGIGVRAEPIRPKVVLLGYFETSRAYGVQGFWGETDKPGELYYWIEGYKLTRRIPVEGAFNEVWANADASIIALKIGPNSLHPAVNVTALGLDRKFDLSQSYWLISGIAGTSPVTGTIGDIVWTDFVVNGDVAHEIDAREIPADWPSGYFPAGKTGPFPQPRVQPGSEEDVRTWPGNFHQNRSRTITQLNVRLTQWAYGLTKDEVLQNTEAMRKVRHDYTQDAARAEAMVSIGATLSAETFWLGGRLDEWARRWIDYMTDGMGRYRTTETNDAGTMVAIAALAQAGRVDPNRVMLLRGASNFDMPPAGIPAAEQLVREGPQAFAGYVPALEGIHSVGSCVVDELIRHWSRYEQELPQPESAPR